MEWFFEAFERLTTSSLIHKAWLGGAFVALAGPALGVFLVLRRYALFSEGIGHIVFGGIGLSMLMNPPKNSSISMGRSNSDVAPRPEQNSSGRLLISTTSS